MNFKSIADLSRDIKDNLSKIPADVDLIVGIPRSGLLAANLLSVYTHIPYLPVDRYIKFIKKENVEPEFDVNRNYRKVLIVDDSLNEGRALARVRQKLAELPSDPGTQFLYLCVYVKPGAEKEIDIPIVSLPKPRLFEWNIFHHLAMGRSIVELENILCSEPDSGNMTEQEYLQALSEAKPQIVPTTTIGCIVSSRPDKYRQLTLEWLEKNNFHFKELVMGLSGPQKAQFYSDFFKMDLYFTSDAVQAENVFKTSQKDVYSVVENKVLTRRYSLHRSKKILFYYYRIIMNKFFRSKEQPQTRKKMNLTG